MPAFFVAAADAVPIKSRFDYWREVAYYSFDADPLSASAAPAFKASGQCLIGDTAHLLAYQSSAVSGTGLPAAYADDRESYLIGLVVFGERHYAETGRDPIISKAGQFFVFDNRTYSRVVWSNHNALHLSLPRAELERRLGGRIPSPATMCRLLETSRMAAALKSQMQMTSAQIVTASDAERAFLLTQLTQLAFFVCETAVGALLGKSSDPQSDLLVSALQLIEQDIANPRLNVASLHRQLGCSRATLYRAFAKAEIAVCDAITQIRIKRAKTMLESSPQTPIGTVAVLCGWPDSSSFARAFRREVGATPSEYRAELCGS
jgi:AraC family transcriptional regulator, positive regulator of tynA and feaB